MRHSSQRLRGCREGSQQLARSRRSRHGCFRLSCCLALLLLSRDARAQSATSPENPALWNQNLEIGPVVGLTTIWHAAPISTAVPLGGAVQLRVRVPPDRQVTWTGAREVKRNRRWSVAEYRPTTTGLYSIIVAYDDASGEQVEERIITDAVDLGAQGVRVADVRLSADSIALDESNLNASTMHYFFMASSVAALRQLGPRHYRTSTGRWLTLEADIVPAAFAPLVEWQLDGRPQVWLGARLRMRVFTVGEHIVKAGPASAGVQLDTYGVRISKSPLRNMFLDGVPVTFAATTDPPGYEDEITWLASTKYGSCQPVLGQGRDFTVLFDDTLGPTGRWLGAKADSDSVSLDNKDGSEGCFPESIDDLNPNRDAFVGWISEESAIAAAEHQFTAAEAAGLFGPVRDYVQREFGGRVKDIQFRFQRSFGTMSSPTSILRGFDSNAGTRLYQLPNRFDWTEWIDMPSAMVGSHLVIPNDEASVAWDSLQGWLSARYGDEAMFTEMQIGFESVANLTIDIYWIATMRWNPPRTHLHTVIVIVVISL